MVTHQNRMVLFLAGIAVVMLLAAACAREGEKAATPAPASGTPAPTAAPKPAPTPVTTGTPAPAPAAQIYQPGAPPPVTGGPLVIGVPIPRSNEKDPGFATESFYKYHPDKLRLWQKATYGGENRGAGFATPTYFDPIRFNGLMRPIMWGMLFLQDMGRCSLVGQQDFSVCNGTRAMNMTTVVVPGIFKTWENPDSLTYIFHLRPGVLWPAIAPMLRTDREVTAADVKWFYETMQRESISKTSLERVAKIEAPDKYTVKFTMSAPEAELIYMLAHHNFGLFSKECYDDKQNCWGQKIITPAPFLMKENETRVRTVWEKNPEFWLKGLPYVDRKIQNQIADPSAVTAAFITGAIDDTTVLLPSQVAQLIKQVPGAQVSDIFGAPGQYHFDMQLDKPPFNDIRVRRAISMAIDRPTAWQLCCESHTMPPMPMPWHLMGRELSIPLAEAGPWYQYNPEKAKQLLTEAGFGNGMKITVTSGYPSGDKADLMLAVAAQLKKNVNVDLDVKVVDSVAHSNVFYEAKWEGFYFTWCAIAGCAAQDATTYILPYYSKSPQNTRHLNDPKWDDLYSKWRAAKDTKEYQNLLWEMNRYEMDNVYKIWIGAAGLFDVMQPWIENCTQHATTWGCSFNGMGYLVMIDPAKKPK
ncbi:MAG: ABC transporter substrate-binding protein [Dehalococcoidia bacterium]|nr:ABC transporter substrate-binding protein [Dehalococcoidia bacterium]